MHGNATAPADTGNDVALARDTVVTADTTLTRLKLANNMCLCCDNVSKVGAVPCLNGHLGMMLNVDGLC